MKKKVLVYSLLYVLFLLPLTSFAQDEDDKTPVYAPWATSMLIDKQTVVSPEAGMFGFRIHHRFGKIEELSDLFGIYAPSNIRLGINYGVTDRIMIGFGTEKNNKIQQFHAKYAILNQTESGSMPFALSYYANIGIDAREEETFGTDYTFWHRMSYFHQLIIARKFGEKLSLQLAPSFAHFNAVDYATIDDNNEVLVPKWKNDVIGAMIGGRYVFYNEMALIFEYNQPFLINELSSYQSEPKPGIGFGIEIGTGTHCFQVFASNYDKIIAQHNLGYTQKELGDLVIGFNITARF